MKKARLRWLPADEGGRRTGLPKVKRYATIARFPDDGPEWPDGAWTVVIEFDQSPDEQGNPSIGAAHFLMNSAPDDRLNGVFELYEGLRKVADVEVLPDN
ncbi:MAG: hypothetical protein ACRD7E_00700 [Bryobacteraceae bacterium]